MAQACILRSNFVTGPTCLEQFQSRASATPARLLSVGNVQQGKTLGSCSSQSTFRIGKIRSGQRGARTVCCATPPDDEVTIDNCTVLVVGGGGVGMEVVRKLAMAGSWVTAFQRGEKFRAEIESLGSMLAVGDVLQPQTLDKALRTNTFDAVISTVGGGMTDINVDSEGVINVIQAAKKAGIPRFILVSSIGVGDSVGALPERELEVLGPVLKEKEKSEDQLRSSGLAWTILRPGGLTSDPPTGSGVLTEDNKIVGIISRADVATLISKILFDKRTEGKVLAAIDSTKLFPGAPAEIKEFILV